MGVVEEEEETETFSSSSFFGLDREICVFERFKCLVFCFCQKSGEMSCHF